MASFTYWIGLLGSFLLGKPFVKANWLTGFDEKGRPIRAPGKLPTPEGSQIMPTVQGGTNWYPPSFSPGTGLFYVSAWENTCFNAVRGGRGPACGGPNAMGQNLFTNMGQPNLLTNTRNESEGYGVVRALDPQTGDERWEFKMTDITWAGVLTTASNLLFGHATSAAIAGASDPHYQDSIIGYVADGNAGCSDDRSPPLNTAQNT
jgi:alcohol dehydrogenase (cytochrome c)